LRVAASKLAASSQARTIRGLARAGSVDLPIARTQAAARCARLADEPGGATSVAGAPVAAVEGPVRAVDAAPLVDVTVLVLPGPHPATSGPTVRARPRAGHLRTPCMEVPRAFTNWLSRRSQRR